MSNVGGKGELAVECHTQVPCSLVGATRELSMVIVWSWTGEHFPGRKSSSVLSRWIFKWCVDIHCVMPSGLEGGEAVHRIGIPQKEKRRQRK